MILYYPQYKILCKTQDEDFIHVKKYLRPIFGKVTAEDVRKIISDLGFSDSQAATVCGPGVTPRLIRRWKKGELVIPLNHFASLVYEKMGQQLFCLDYTQGDRWWNNEFDNVS